MLNVTCWRAGPPGLQHSASRSPCPSQQTPGQDINISQQKWVEINERDRDTEIKERETEIKERDRERNRDTERERDRDTERETEIQREKQRYKTEKQR